VCFAEQLLYAELAQEQHIQQRWLLARRPLCDNSKCSSRLPIQNSRSGSHTALFKAAERVSFLRSASLIGFRVCWIEIPAGQLRDHRVLSPWKARHGRSRETRTRLNLKFPVNPEKFPVIQNNFPVTCVGNSRKDRCGTALFCSSPAPESLKIAKFPVKFPVSREFAWRRVRSALRRQPGSRTGWELTSETGRKARRWRPFAIQQVVSMLPISPVMA
jgi:hypothetical protein